MFKDVLSVVETGVAIAFVLVDFVIASPLGMV